MVQILKVFLSRGRPWLVFLKMKYYLQLHAMFSVQSSIKWGCRILLPDKQMLGLLSVGPFMEERLFWVFLLHQTVGTDLQKRDLLEIHMLAVMSTAGEKVTAAVKFFLRASLRTAAFPSVLEESSDTNFHTFQQKQFVLY